MKLRPEVSRPPTVLFRFALTALAGRFYAPVNVIVYCSKIEPFQRPFSGVWLTLGATLC